MSADQSAVGRKAVLVVGASGNLGGRAVDLLLQQGHTVHALARKGSKVDALRSKKVRIVEGDLTDPPSLARALEGIGVVLTTAQGYARRPEDSLETVDDQGNRNLADAASAAGVSRFVFTSILTCDLAKDVPHFYQKKLIEDYLEKKGLPFVALRPGAFLGNNPYAAEALKKGEVQGFGPPDVAWTSIHIDDVARSLALAVDHPRAVKRRIDLGMDRAITQNQLVQIFRELSGREFRLAVPAVAGWMSRMSPKQQHDMMAMVAYFGTGKYVADTTVQAELFPPVPTVKDTATRLLREAGIGVNPPT